MAYSAVVAKVQTRPHPNADRLQLGLVKGYQVVIGLDVVDGTLGVFFASDGQLSEEMCAANDLVGYTDPETGEKKGGFFPKSRRVRAQNFRGVKSDGYWTTLDHLAFTGYDVSRLGEGDEFTELNGVPVCNKYYTPATLRAMQKGGVQRRENSLFHKHVETAQLKREVDAIPGGSIITITEKLHGTSGRFGYVLDDVEQPQTWLQRLLRRPKRTERQYRHLLGTRNTILADRSVTSFYGSEEFRWESVAKLEGNLHKGEVIYYELTGYSALGSPIMGQHSTSHDKALRKQYGDFMTYSYGQPDGTCGLWVYRITRTNEDGNVIELSWPQVKKRCDELGLSYVPEYGNQLMFWAHEREELLALTADLGEGASTLDPRHIREGVVVRVDDPLGDTRFLKAKSHTFGVCEGYIKEDDDYVDTEEIA
jgi:hypothetical protein